jgi:hypothetical protein
MVKRINGGRWSSDARRATWSTIASSGAGATIIGSGEGGELLLRGDERSEEPSGILPH